MRRLSSDCPLLRFVYSSFVSSLCAAHIVLVNLLLFSKPENWKKDFVTNDELHFIPILFISDPQQIPTGYLYVKAGNFGHDKNRFYLIINIFLCESRPLRDQTLRFSALVFFR